MEVQIFFFKFNSKKYLDNPERAQRLLGYPKCCVQQYNSGLNSLILTYRLYSLIKQVRSGRKLKQELIELSRLDPALGLDANDIEEVLTDTQKFRENFEFGRQILESFL